jgi:rhodanese-related sulfurtransferase
MTGDAPSWLGQVPWGPVAVVALLAVFFVAKSFGGKKKKAALVEKLAAGAQVVDVRTPGEFSSGHYAGAINVPVDTLGSKAKKLGAADKPVVVCCASGARSARAAGILRSAGFTDVTDAGAWTNLP